MLLPFTVQQCQMLFAGTQAQNLNYVAWKNHSCIFSICWNTALKRIYCSRKPAKTIRIQKFQIFLSIFNTSLANTWSYLTFFHDFHLTTMMKSQYLISWTHHYSITLHTWHSWMLSASLTITQVRVYVHLIHFQSQGHRRKCRKLQSLVYLNQAQTDQVQLPKQAFFETHLLCWLGKGKQPCHH